MFRSWRIHLLSLRTFVSRSDQEVKIARDWLKTLDSKTVPRHICEISFSRSSGPGGQNVNKSVTPLDASCAIAEFLQGQLQSDLEGPLRIVVAIGSTIDTPTAT